MINESTLRENFCRNFNMLMEVNDKKQLDVARDMHISTSTINDWSKGHKVPRLDKIKKIAEYFGVEANDLLSSRKIPDYNPDMLTLIDLYSRLDSKGKQAVMSLARTLAE